ncbi:MAG: acyltransferase [Acidimicrobiia bacterium]|nr:acyltransferase [Acidimicrobiia bacterium]
MDELVDATPERRDRTVDALRALAIVVVVLWHWVFSITHVEDGQLVMPNPIGEVPGLWAATWVLQVMPIFFIVGGFANLAAWDASHRRGEGDLVFLRSRTERLLRPAAVLVAVWAALEALRLIFVPSVPSVLEWGMVVFIPLWFLGTYLGVVLLVPLTARAHRRFGLAAAASMLAVVAACDALRLGAGIEGPGLAGVSLIGVVGSIGVWLFAHQLGYLWRDRGLSVRVGAAVAATAVAALSLLSVVGPYPTSMVTVRGGDSNLFPTTIAVAALALVQVGLIGVCHRPLSAFLERRRAWKAVVMTNAVAMTVFCWHMTALVAAIGLWHLGGGTLGDEPTTSWWSTRPLWIVLPGLLLAPLVALFWRFERSSS